MALADLTGKKFSYWTVISYHGGKGICQHLWRCRCACGKVKLVFSSNLRSKSSRSCGCAGLNKRHGMHGTPTYSSWQAMRTRSTNPNIPNARWYTQLGIGCCKRWEKFENFFADMGERPPGMVLDRINTFKGYTKKNCRWTTQLQNGQNKRNSFGPYIEGETTKQRSKRYYDVWYAKNKQHVLEVCKRYKVNNRDRVRKWAMARYYRNHEEHLRKIREYRKRRKLQNG